MINPFIISSIAEQAQFRQMNDAAVWQTACRALGATPDTIAAYDGRARWFAMTTPYMNSDVVAYCRQIALDALRRGEVMPPTPEAAIEAENARRMAQSIRGLESLKNRFNP